MKVQWDNKPDQDERENEEPSIFDFIFSTFKWLFVLAVALGLLFVVAVVVTMACCSR